MFAISVSACGGAPTKPSTETGLMCGEERWSVKTLSDPDAGRVNLTPIATTIGDLTSHPAHCDLAPDQRVYDEEFQTYELVGRVTVVRMEDDRDYHVAVADLTDTSVTMIVEFPDPGCEGAISSPFLQMLKEARQALITLFGGRSASNLVGQTLRLRGVGFYDVRHGQTGIARNCIELHPVLHVETVR
jgi:hypothetical protein